MNQYPLGDFLIGLKNAHMAGKGSVSASHSKKKEAVAKLLVEHGFLSEAKVNKKGKFPILEVAFPSVKLMPSFSVKLFSKPGRRYYVGAKKIPFARGKGALVIISTPKGVMAGRKARKENLGGEVIAHLW